MFTPSFDRVLLKNQPENIKNTKKSNKSKKSKIQKTLSSRNPVGVNRPRRICRAKILAQ